MRFLYSSERVGRHGRLFLMLKIKTLRDGVGSFAHEREYVLGGRFMRKWRIDEIPQLWCILNGSMSLFGPRPREAKEINLYPPELRTKLLSVKPGLFALAGIFFLDEEYLLKHSRDASEDYFKKILPIKLALDMFYIDHKCWLLNIAIVWMALKARILNV